MRPPVAITSVPFETLYRQEHSDEKPLRLLCIDPGDTTGVCYFQGSKLVGTKQVVGNHRVMNNLIRNLTPDVLVVESYHIYASKVKQHTHSDVPTLRLIGGIEMVAMQTHVPIAMQSAATAKGFVTDQKLKDWGLWQTQHRHANDSIRHGVYYLLFGKRPA